MNKNLKMGEGQESATIIEAIFDEAEIAKWDNREYGADEEYAELAE